MTTLREGCAADGWMVAGCGVEGMASFLVSLFAGCLFVLGGGRQSKKEGRRIRGLQGTGSANQRWRLGGAARIIGGEGPLRYEQIVPVFRL